jgi:ATP-binding cassette subfamily C protein CydC
LERLAAFETSRLRQAAVGARGTGLARAITAAALLLVIVSAGRHGAPVAIVVFLGLLTVGVMTGIERLVPAAQAGRLARQAGRRIDATETEPSRTPPSLRVTYEHGELAVSEYRLPETPSRIGRLVEFRVPAGATVILTGASGAGKTTLLEAIQAALRERAGSVVTAVRAEDYTFTGTVADNIRLADPAAGDEAIGDLLDAMMLNVAPDTRLGFGGRLLSGGEERRLHIARALAPLPDVLIVDEPTTGLDGATATHVMAEIRRRLPDSVLVMAMHEPAPEFLTEGVHTVSLN